MTTAQPVPFITDPTGREHLLTGETITIGRAVENDIIITSKRVSRKHARVRARWRWWKT
jgi:pSer/pThr/pTyr-binding forkhead associated (FHA) protein